MGEWNENSAVVINLLKYNEWWNLCQRKRSVKYTLMRREVIVVKDVYSLVVVTADVVVSPMYFRSVVWQRMLEHGNQV